MTGGGTAPDPHPAISSAAMTTPAAARSSFFMRIRRSAVLGGCTARVTNWVPWKLWYLPPLPRSSAEAGSSTQICLRTLKRVSPGGGRATVAGWICGKRIAVELGDLRGTDRRWAHGDGVLWWEVRACEESWPGRGWESSY